MLVLLFIHSFHFGGVYSWLQLLHSMLRPWMFKLSCCPIFHHFSNHSWVIVAMSLNWVPNKCVLKLFSWNTRGTGDIFQVQSGKEVDFRKEECGKTIKYACRKGKKEKWRKEGRKKRTEKEEMKNNYIRAK